MRFRCNAVNHTATVVEYLAKKTGGALDEELKGFIVEMNEGMKDIIGGDSNHLLPLDHVSSLYADVEDKIRKVKALVNDDLMNLVCTDDAEVMMNTFEMLHEKGSKLMEDTDDSINSLVVTVNAVLPSFFGKENVSILKDLQSDAGQILDYRNEIAVIMEQDFGLEFKAKYTKYTLLAMKAAYNRLLKRYRDMESFYEIVSSPETDGVLEWSDDGNSVVFAGVRRVIDAWNAPPNKTAIISAITSEYNKIGLIVQSVNGHYGETYFRENFAGLLLKYGFIFTTNERFYTGGGGNNIPAKLGCSHPLFKRDNQKEIRKMKPIIGETGTWKNVTIMYDINTDPSVNHPEGWKLETAPHFRCAAAPNGVRCSNRCALRPCPSTVGKRRIKTLKRHQFMDYCPCHMDQDTTVHDDEVTDTMHKKAEEAIAKRIAAGEQWRVVEEAKKASLPVSSI